MKEIRLKLRYFIIKNLRKILFLVYAMLMLFCTRFTLSCTGGLEIISVAYSYGFFFHRFDENSMKEIFNSNKIALKGSKESIKIDHLGDLRRPVHSCLLSTLSKALGDRVELIGLRRTSSVIWDYGDSVPRSSPSLSVGLVIHPTNCTALLTKVIFVICMHNLHMFYRFIYLQRKAWTNFEEVYRAIVALILCKILCKNFLI